MMANFRWNSRGKKEFDRAWVQVWKRIPFPRNRFSVDAFKLVGKWQGKHSKVGLREEALLSRHRVQIKSPWPLVLTSYVRTRFSPLSLISQQGVISDVNTQRNLSEREILFLPWIEPNEDSCCDQISRDFQELFIRSIGRAHNLYPFGNHLFSLFSTTEHLIQLYILEKMHPRHSLKCRLNTDRFRRTF